MSVEIINWKNSIRIFQFLHCAVFLVPGDKLNDLEESVRAFKREFFNDEDVIIHLRDIRKQEKTFSILLYPEVRERFYEGINAILGEHDT